MDDVDIVWHGSLVGRLANVQAETIFVSVGDFGGEVKCEGDFIPAVGEVADDFRRRLQALETLEVTSTGDRIPKVIYWRGHGRAKLAWHLAHSGL